MRYFDRTNISKIKKFISRVNKSSIHKILNNKIINIKSQKVGQGQIGTIYLIEFYKKNIKIFELIVKEQKLDSRYRYENAFNKITSAQINKKATPNFIKHYGSFIKNNYVYFLMENADRRLDNFFKINRTDKEFKSFCFQILHGLFIINKLKSCHRDITYKNIMYIKLKNSDDKFFNYKINGIK